MILASTTQRAVAVVIVLAALAAWAVYIVLENRRSTKDIVDSFLDAPNRKAPPDDEVFEGRRLDRFLVAALVGTSVLAISLPLYWLGEPGRQKILNPLLKVLGVVIPKLEQWRQQGENLDEQARYQYFRQQRTVLDDRRNKPAEVEARKFGNQLRA